MGTREDAIAILHEMFSCSPRPLVEKMNEAQKGVGFVLAYLVKASGEVIAGDLAKEMNVSTARIAAMLRTMEKNGLIMRHKGSIDSRRTVVEITPLGTARAAEIREQLLQKIELLIDKVGKEDLEDFIRISKKIKTAMEE